MLVGAFPEEEIKEAVWSCDNSESPGPYGFNMGFIKFCWDFIKADVMAAMKGFESCRKWLRGTNASLMSIYLFTLNSFNHGLLDYNNK